jgi:hypothetical protein
METLDFILRAIIMMVVGLWAAYCLWTCFANAVDFLKEKFFSKEGERYG